MNQINPSSDPTIHKAAILWRQHQLKAKADSAQLNLLNQTRRDLLFLLDHRLRLGPSPASDPIVQSALLWRQAIQAGQLKSHPWPNPSSLPPRFGSDSATL